MPRDFIHGEKRISWMWIIRDLLFRIILYLSLPLLAVRFLGVSLVNLGFVMPSSKQLLIAIILSLFAFVLCLYFRGTSSKRRHLHPGKDFWFSLYLVFINSPTEELFYRGFLLFFFGKMLGSPVYGVVLSSLLFGLAHVVFFGASMKTVLFDTFGGFFLGFSFLFLGKSLVPVILIHGASNLALFTLGAYILNRRRFFES
jgi:membrane protease YdiL (CAAX protease family)